MASKSVEYQVQVVFRTMLGNLERDSRKVITNIKNIGETGRKAGKVGSAGLDQISDAADDTSRHLKSTEQTAVKLSNALKTVVKAAAVGYVTKKLADLGTAAVTEYGKTQTALGEVASLGYEDMKGLEEAAIDFSNTWSGTTRDEFISAAYDIKSGIASLSDEGVAKFTELSGLTAKATKASVSEMTSLFATGYGIYRKFYSSDMDFGSAFSAGIAKSVQQFKTDGAQMAGAIQTLGASASSANVPLGEQFTILGMLQQTMSGSESGTKYRAFLQSAARAGKSLGLSFLDANNQLKSMPEILEQLHSKFGESMDAMEKEQLKQAFGTDEAVALVDLLYEKTDELKSNVDAVNQSVQGGTKSVEAMADMMNRGPLKNIEKVKQAWGNVLNEMGRQMAPGVNVGLEELHETLVELQSSGDFSRLGESIGKLVQAGSDLVVQFLDRAPGAIDALADGTQWLADNLDLVTFAGKTLLQLWIGFKTASVVTKIFGNIGHSAAKLTKLLKSGKDAVAVLKIALKTGFKTNALGLIITVLISLISWLAKATAGVEGFKNKCNAAWISIQITFSKTVLGMKKTLQGLLDFFGIGIKMLDDSIAKSEKKIADLEKKKKSLKKSGKSKKKKGDKEEDPQKDTKPDSGSGGTGIDILVPTPDYGGAAVSYSAPKTIQDRIDQIDSNYAPNLENLQLKADLAEGDNKTSESRNFKEQAKALLQKQANDLLALERTKGGNDRTLVENARLNIMKKIQDLTQDIRDGVGKLTGEFNTPSDIVPMTKYEYMVSKAKNGAVSQYFGKGNVEMQFNIRNPDGLTVAQLEEYIRNWAITGAMTAGNVDYSQAKDMADQITRY